MHDKPVVMLDPFGHYDGLRAWLYGLIDSGYVTQNALGPARGDRRHRRCPRGLRTGPLMAITCMVLGCRSTTPRRGRPHDRREIGDPQQRRAARHRHPCTRPDCRHADHPARCHHRVRGQAVGQDVDRQGIPGPRGAATATRSSSSSRTRRSPTGRPTRPSTATRRCWPLAASATATWSASCCATRPSRCCSCWRRSSAARSPAC